LCDTENFYELYKTEAMKQILFLLMILSGITRTYAAKVDTLKVVSSLMHKTITNIVIIPDGDKIPKNGFPVVYLLHGAYGNQNDWITKVPLIKEYADQYQLMIVCPDGGFTSWYFDSVIDSTMKYETYVSKELIVAIDTKYHTIADKKGRAITGLSMGGHGAFYLAFRHQDVWGAAGSMSGGLDIRPFPNSWDIAKRLGSFAGNKETWENNTDINLIYLLDGKSPKLIFDCGTSDFFYDCNKRMHTILLERNIPHDYTERPGKHDWQYWSNSIKYHLLFFNDFFNTNNNN
jgi:S-formylglutathione hydrolase FrmB